MSEANTLTNISYTIHVGNAPGPDLTDENLILNLLPNPVFAEDGSALEDNHHIIGKSSWLTLKVSAPFVLELMEIMACFVRATTCQVLKGVR